MMYLLFSVGFLVLHNDDVYAIADDEDNLMFLGIGKSKRHSAVVNRAYKVEALCGKGVKGIFTDYLTLII